MNNLVSIIIPIGSIESYINECLECVLKQTYKNIEVIIVNKFSKDNTMKICNYYSKKDKRVKVINIDARKSLNPKNVGIENSKGQYITFIDGGDRVSEDYIEYLLDKAKNNMDMVCVNSHDISKKSNYSKQYSIYKGKDVLEQYLHMNLRSTSYGKLYKRELFNDIKYPECNIYDDFMTTYKLYDKANKVFNSKLNKYYIVEDKNIKAAEISDKDKMMKMQACLNMLEFIENNYPNLIDYCKTKICYEAIALFKIMKDDKSKRQLYKYIKLYRKYALRDSRFNFSKKLLCIRSIFGYNFMKISFYLEKSV
ncbi:MAG TPA: glycosyltransferase [Bacilli bacterium]|nr:glycosyltransferase [Bacilli bacterium]